MKSNQYILCLFLAFYASCTYTTYEQGKRIFEAKCSNCHMEDGSGLNKLIPSLNNSFETYSPQQISCIIKLGKKDDRKLLAMPPYPDITEAEMSNLLNYLKEKFSKDKTELAIKEVAAYSCE